ncbi:electron carrier/ protein disulfide oxidoreductase [Anaeramoeba ignava]|uniref:Electron carrier/ protein disulfide oxidoreductase n=1 Tax=Anaeramoeba ignava TaxID=1746090 RepID=A0A9Q0R743_ANAIG|nr:electron carrier/ protein disulfide oxidoreductase [Anaeramoeba ignava]|eukprot:Anaeramoba_ignava/a91150_28.p1 GENE.a91150_28~~a91150_28.p1  ORF type:complete len:789 (-),score=323.71 a91150_28:2-2335(-)
MSSVLKQQEEEIQKLQTKLGKIQKEIKDLEKKQETKRLQKKLETAQTLLKEKVAENNKSRNELNDLQQKLETIRKENMKQNNQYQNGLINYVNETNENKFDKVEKLKAKIKNLQNEKKKLENDNLKEKIEKELQENQENLKNLLKENDDLKQKLNETSQKNENFQSIYQKIVEKLVGVDNSKIQQFQQINKQIEDIKNQLQVYQKIEPKKQEKNSISAAKTLEELTKELENQKIENAKLEKEIEEMKLMAHNLDTANDGILTTDLEFSDLSELEDSGFSNLTTPIKTVPSENFQNISNTKTMENLQNLDQDKNEKQIEKESKREKLITKKKSQMIVKRTSENQNEIETIHELITIPQAVDYFKEFLSQELNQENIMFYMDAIEYRKIRSQKTRQRTAKAIYEKYIKPESLFEINIDFRTRNEIIQLVESDQISIEIFDKAQEVVLTLMEQNSFEPFKQSKLYQELIEKMSAGANYSIFSSIKTAVLVSKERNASILNLSSNAPDKTCDPIRLSQKLLEYLIDLLNAHYSISTEEINCELIRHSIPFRRFTQLTTRLQKVKLKGLVWSQLFIFFVNIYNVLSIHSALVNGISQERNFLKKFMQNSKYLIGREVYSLDDIKNGILRGNRDKGTKITSKYFKETDKRVKYTVSPVDPRFHFVLVNFDAQKLPVRVLYVETFYQELANATSNFLNNQVKILATRKKVLLPRVFHEFQRDFKRTQTRTLHWIAEFLKPEKAKQLLNDASSFTVKYHKPANAPLLVFDENYTSINQKTQEKKI